MSNLLNVTQVISGRIWIQDLNSGSLFQTLGSINTNASSQHLYKTFCGALHIFESLNLYQVGTKINLIFIDEMKEVPRGHGTCPRSPLWWMVRWSGARDCILTAMLFSSLYHPFQACSKASKHLCQGSARAAFSRFWIIFFFLKPWKAIFVKNKGSSRKYPFIFATAFLLDGSWQLRERIK